MLLEKYYTVYAERDDMTFIMRETLKPDGSADATEVVGWHYGEPCNASRDYIGKTKAEY
jgi:hypothetical protein